MLRFARGSGAWLTAPLVAALGLGLAGLWVAWAAWLAIVPLVVFLAFAAFFRDPERTVAEGFVSPADGKVVFIDEVEDADLGRVQRYSIFMHPKDVHVNRYPLDAVVESVTHVPGKHIPAFNKESERNERVETILELPGAERIKLIQIAGAVARRIVPYHKAGDVAEKGGRMGLIRMGSRCDILVPPGRVAWTVQPGTQVYGASTTLGHWLEAPSAEPEPAAPAKPARPAKTAARRPKKGAS